MWRSTLKPALGRARNYLRYQLAWRTGRRGRDFEGHYAVWRTKRILTILDEYGHRFFEGKTLLELGAGYGDIGGCFAALGAKVTCLEGRARNVAAIQRRFPGVAASQHDLNLGLPGTERYDVILHLGVLYHLSGPEQSLRDSCRRCDHLILETEVSDSDDPNFVCRVKEASYIYDQALDGAGCRPSPAHVERILTDEGFKFTRLDDDRCNWELHVYDWPITNSKTYRSGLRRMWFARRERAG